MIDFDTWLEQVEEEYGAKIVKWMLPFAKDYFDMGFSAAKAAIELNEVWLDHNDD